MSGSATSVVSEQVFGTLSVRATRLAEQVEFATRRSSNPEIRREGARFSEVLEEWLEQIKELREANDEALRDTVRSFLTRLKMAEDRVEKWFKQNGAEPLLLAIHQREPKARKRSIPVPRKKAG